MGDETCESTAAFIRGWEIFCSYSEMSSKPLGTDRLLRGKAAGEEVFWRLGTSDVLLLLGFSRIL